MTKTLEFVRGETVELDLNLTNPITGDAFTVLSTDIIRFGMETEDGYSILKSSTTGAATITIPRTDTAGITPGTYFYDIGLQRGSDYYVIIQKSIVEVIDNVSEYEE